MSLIPYAGASRHDAAFGEVSPARAATAYKRFLQGMDTYDIARRYSVSEATALKWITQERCLRLGLRSPFKSKEAA